MQSNPQVIVPIEYTILKYSGTKNVFEILTKQFQ